MTRRRTWATVGAVVAIGSWILLSATPAVAASATVNDETELQTALTNCDTPIDIAQSFSAPTVTVTTSCAGVTINLAGFTVELQSIRLTGSADLTINGGGTLTVDPSSSGVAPVPGAAGISVPVGTTVTLDDVTVNASGGGTGDDGITMIGGGAGIGGDGGTDSAGVSAGTINLTNSVVTSVGGSDVTSTGSSPSGDGSGAGIGGGGGSGAPMGAQGTDATGTGASGGDGGSGTAGFPGGNGGIVTITGGSVTARSQGVVFGGSAAGIGGGGGGAGGAGGAGGNGDTVGGNGGNGGDGAAGGNGGTVTIN